MINTVHLDGTLGHNPEIREFSSGGCVYTFNFCHNINKKNQNGEWESEPNWFSAKLFMTQDQRVKVGAMSLKKGDRLLLSGQLRVEKYMSKEGQEKSKTYILVKSYRDISIPAFLNSAQAAVDNEVNKDVKETIEEEDENYMPF